MTPAGPRHQPESPAAFPVVDGRWLLGRQAKPSANVRPWQRTTRSGLLKVWLTPDLWGRVPSPRAADPYTTRPSGRWVQVTVWLTIHCQSCSRRVVGDTTASRGRRRGHRLRAVEGKERHPAPYRLRWPPSTPLSTHIHPHPVAAFAVTVRSRTQEALPPRREKGPLACCLTCSGGRI